MNRYEKQLILSEIGLIGQSKLKNARVLIVGAGGLGTPLSTYLTALGVGTIGIVDFDVVDPSNLHRQFAYKESDLGKKKVEILSNQLSLQNPSIEIINYTEKINPQNINAIFSNYSIVCDCTDNVESRLLIDESCSQLNLPLVFATVQGWQGYITILNYIKKIRLTDIFTYDNLIQSTTNNCEINGVLPTTCGIIGSYQACEIVKLILNIHSELDGTILCIDTLNHSHRMLKLQNSSNQ